jgi:hypothetical protein
LAQPARKTTPAMAVPAVITRRQEARFDAFVIGHRLKHFVDWCFLWGLPKDSEKNGTPWKSRFRKGAYSYLAGEYSNRGLIYGAK